MKHREVLAPGFTRLAWSNLCAQSAEQVGLAAAPLLAVFYFQASAADAAWLQTVQSLPFLLLAVPAGVLADRAPRGALLATAEFVRLLAFAVVLLMLAAGSMTMALLALLGFVGAAATVAYNVTVPGLVPQLVARHSLPLANSKIELARSLAFAVGPGAAGLLYNAYGAPLAYTLALGLSACAVVLLRGLPSHAAARRPRRMRHELAEGFRHTWGSDLLRPVLLTAVFFNMSWFLLQAAYVPYAAQILGLSAAQIGATLAVYGLGMVAGALLAPRIARRLRFGTMIMLGPLGGLAGALTMAATIGYPSVWLAYASFFLFGAGPVLWAISTATLRQAITPTELIGRVSAVIMTFTFGARPLGAALAAMLSARYGVWACVLAATAGFAVQLAIIARSRVPGLRAVPA